MAARRASPAAISAPPGPTSSAPTRVRQAGEPRTAWARSSDSLNAITTEAGAFAPASFFKNPTDRLEVFDSLGGAPSRGTGVLLELIGSGSAEILAAAAAIVTGRYLVEVLFQRFLLQRPEVLAAVGSEGARVPFER